MSAGITWNSFFGANKNMWTTDLAYVNNGIGFTTDSTM